MVLGKLRKKAPTPSSSTAGGSREGVSPSLVSLKRYRGVSKQFRWEAGREQIAIKAEETTSTRAGDNSHHSVGGRGNYTGSCVKLGLHHKEP